MILVCEIKLLVCVLVYIHLKKIFFTSDTICIRKVSLQLYQLHNSKFNFTCSCMLCSQTTVLNSQSCIPHSHRFHCCDFTSSHSHRKLHTAHSQISLLWLYKFTQSHKVAYCTLTDFTVVTLQVHTVTESCIQCSHIFHQCNSTMWQRFHNSNSTKLHRLHDSNFIKLHPAQSHISSF